CTPISAFSSRTGSSSGSCTTTPASWEPTRWRACAPCWRAAGASSGTSSRRSPRRCSSSESPPTP
ncbi:MAG: hypothetical protein AVDCRST_MAG50-2135, partial [uncultured Acidimicrobiales bacterium]